MTQTQNAPMLLEKMMMPIDLLETGCHKSSICKNAISLNYHKAQDIPIRIIDLNTSSGISFVQFTFAYVPQLVFHSVDFFSG